MEVEDESQSLLPSTNSVAASASYIHYMAKYFSRPILKTGILVCAVAVVIVIVDLVNLRPDFALNSVDIQSNGPNIAININAYVKTHQYFSELHVSSNSISNDRFSIISCK